MQFLIKVLSQISQTTDILEYFCEITCVTSFFMSQKGLVAFRSFVFKFSRTIFTSTFQMNSSFLVVFKDSTTSIAHSILFNLRYFFQMIFQTFLQCESSFTFSNLELKKKKRIINYGSFNNYVDRIWPFFSF